MRARQEAMFVKNPTLNEAMRITEVQASHPNRWVTYVWEQGNKVIYEVRRPSAEKKWNPNHRDNCSRTPGRWITIDT